MNKEKKDIKKNVKSIRQYIVFHNIAEETSNTYVVINKPTQQTNSPKFLRIRNTSGLKSCNYPLKHVMKEINVSEFIVCPHHPSIHLGQTERGTDRPMYK